MKEWVHYWPEIACQKMSLMTRVAHSSRGLLTSTVLGQATLHCLTPCFQRTARVNEHQEWPPKLILSCYYSEDARSFPIPYIFICTHTYVSIYTYFSAGTCKIKVNTTQ